MENCIVTQSRLLIKQWLFGFIESSPLTRSKIHEKLIWFTHASSFLFHEGQLFYWSIMTAVDSIKCRCAHSGMTSQVGGFQNPGVCLQAFPSFLPHSLSTLFLVPFFAQSVTLVSCSLLLNRTETLATQATLNWTHDFPRDVSQNLQYHSSFVTKSLSNHGKFVKTFPTRLYTTIQHLFKNKAFLALVSLKPMSVSCLRMVWNKKMHIL